MAVLHLYLKLGLAQEVKRGFQVKCIVYIELT